MAKCVPPQRRREREMAQSLIDSLTQRPCPICGESAGSTIFAESNVDPSRLDVFAFASRKLPEFMHYRLLQCAQCDLIYASPTPSVGFLATAYEEAGFDSAIEAEYASRTYAAVVSRLCSRLPDRSGALDIGTGDGCFLEKLLEVGFTGVRGVEPSCAPILAARPEIRPLIRHGLFDAADFDAESFRLITCFQTIEHVNDPMQMVYAAETLLKPRGALLLICHNRRGLVNTVLGSKSPIRDIEHLQLFSPRSVTELLRNAGFVDVKVAPIVNSYPIGYWLRLMPLAPGVKMCLSRLTKFLGLGSLALPLPVGNLAAVGFKP
jgi:SAM-dependent methyltransferase